jgi:hypothetical protein
MSLEKFFFSKTAIKTGELAQILSKLVEAHRELKARIKTLEERLDQGKGLRYRGVFQAAETYQEGNMVTFKGALWIAVKGTRSKPGEPDSGWQLAVKSGRNDS